MGARSKYVWVVYFVGFDDPEDVDSECVIPPHVVKERLRTTDDPANAYPDLQLSVLARGGELLAVVTDDEAHAELIRSESEHAILKGR